MINHDNKAVPMGTKISPAAAEVWNAICDSLRTDTYHMLQNFIYMTIRAAADPHKVNPDIQKLLAMLESDAGWQRAFNLVAPNTVLKVAQVVLILEQEGRKGFGAVMVDKPYMDKATMTECVDDILERVTEVTMHGIYRRLRLVGGMMKCNHLSDILLDMIERQGKDLREEDDRIQMQGEAQFTDSGKRIEYGKRTKAKHHRTPDGEAQRQQRIQFDDEDATTTDTPDDRPYGEKADEYMKQLEEQARAEEADDMEKEMGFRPHGEEW